MCPCAVQLATIYIYISNISHIDTPRENQMTKKKHIEIRFAPGKDGTIRCSLWACSRRKMEPSNPEWRHCLRTAASEREWDGPAAALPRHVLLMAATHRCTASSFTHFIHVAPNTNSLILSIANGECRQIDADWTNVCPRFMSSENVGGAPRIFDYQSIIVKVDWFVCW